PERVEHTLLQAAGGGIRLRPDYPPGPGVDCDDIGERAADVDGKTDRTSLGVCHLTTIPARGNAKNGPSALHSARTCAIRLIWGGMPSVDEILASPPLSGLRRVTRRGGNRQVVTVRLAEQFSDLNPAPARSMVILSRAASAAATDYRLDMALRWAAVHNVAAVGCFA